MGGRFLLFSHELARTRGDEARSIAGNAAALVAARVLPRLVQVGYVILLARRVGPELYGLFAYTQSWYLTLLPLTSFGLYVLLARIGTVVYFGFFILLPFVSKADGNGPVPDRVTYHAH